MTKTRAQILVDLSTLTLNMQNLINDLIELEASGDIVAIETISTLTESFIETKKALID